jgi:Family of unknown function (DUF6527)
MKQSAVAHEFVEHLPDELQQGRIYVSIPFATAAHKCCCGCGNEVVTPLSPTGWSLTFDGETVSLDPSIGNWSFPCQSHYWITRNKVNWARRWSQKEIERGRQRDRGAKQTYFEEKNSAKGALRRNRERREDGSSGGA